MPFQGSVPETSAASALSRASADHHIHTSAPSSPSPLSMPSPAYRIRDPMSAEHLTYDTESHAQMDQLFQSEIAGSSVYDEDMEAGHSAEHPSSSRHLYSSSGVDLGVHRQAVAPSHRDSTRVDTREEHLNLSTQSHHGHTSVLKVRPAIEVPHLKARTCEGHGHSTVSKVGPLCDLPSFLYPEHILQRTGARPSCAAGNVSPSQSPISCDAQFAEVSQKHSVSIGDVRHWERPISPGSSASNISPRRSAKEPVDGRRSGYETDTQAPNTTSPTRILTVTYQGGDYESPVNALLGCCDNQTTGGAALSPAPWKILYPHPPSHRNGYFPQEHPGHSHTSKVRPQCEDSVFSQLLWRGFTHAVPDREVAEPDIRLVSSKSVPELRYQNLFHQSSQAQEPPGSTEDRGFWRWARWLRNVTVTPEAHRTRSSFTSFPATRPTSTTQSPTFKRSRKATQANSGLLETELRNTVSNLEQLLEEAAMLATKAANLKDAGCIENLELTKADCYGAPRSPPSVHESVPSADGASSEGGGLQRPLGGAREDSTAVKVPLEPRAVHLPKRYRSVPVFSGAAVQFSLPKGSSSTLKLESSQPDTTVGTGENRPSGRTQATRVPCLLTSQEEGRDELGSRCRNGVEMVRRIRSRAQQRSVNRRAIGYGPALPNDEDRPSRSSPKSAKCRPEGRSRIPTFWGCDGTNDAQIEGLSENDAKGRDADNIHTSQAKRLQRLSPTLQEVHSEPERESALQRNFGGNRFSLRGKSHVSLRGYQGFSLARAYRRPPVARDWSDVRKRFVAAVACLSTALIGVLIGIYAGLVPSIQYWIADLNHYAILGNVFFYLGLAISSFFFWPLPLLHGRKPYILSSLVLAMPLLFPQAIAVSDMRSPYVSTWR